MTRSFGSVKPTQAEHWCFPSLKALPQAYESGDGSRFSRG
jgi:hypothetical protein